MKSFAGLCHGGIAGSKFKPKVDAKIKSLKDAMAEKTRNKPSALGEMDPKDAARYQKYWDDIHSGNKVPPGMTKDEYLKYLKGLEKVKGAGGAKLKMDSKQFGKKVGKHATDYGLDPSNPASRTIIKNKINDIFKNADVVKTGTWRGLGEKSLNGSNAPGPAKFYIKGNDVVVTDMKGNFVTILKDGVKNSRVIEATSIK